MKTISILVILIAFNVSIVVADYIYPQYSLTIENQQVSGASLHFDVFLTSRDTSVIYYSGSILAIYFNQQYFSNPSVQMSVPSNSRFAMNYRVFSPTIDTTVTGTRYVSWTIADQGFPFEGFGCENFTDAQVIAELNAKLQVFTTYGQKVKLAHFVVSGISDTNGTAGLQWHYVSSSGMPEVVTRSACFMKADSLLDPGHYPCWKGKRMIPVDTAATFPAPANISLRPSKVTSVSEPLSSGAFSLVPNPVSDVDFSVRSPFGLGKIGIKVVSVLGEEVFSGSAESGNMHFRLPAETASGRYTVRLYSEKGEYVGALPLVVSR